MATDLRDVEQYLFHEAMLLDNRKFDEWLTLFTEDALYWVPANAYDINPMLHVSFIYDDINRMQDRVWSVQSGVRWSQDPQSRTRHLITNIVITEENGNEVTVSSNFVMFEIRRAIYGDRYFAGRFEHRLRKDGNSWKIAFKKIELLNNDAPVENLTFII
jgi:3-phenylpropionate/cinnamic acid dioxygenase small subunit